MSQYENTCLKFDNWSSFLLASIVLVVIITILIGHKEQPKEKSIKSTATRQEKAWKHWEDYWCFYEPLEGAWSHKDPTDYLYYIKDKRTNLCFAVATPFGQDGYMATVPCNKVEDLLENSHKKYTTK